MSTLGLQWLVIALVVVVIVCYRVAQHEPPDATGTLAGIVAVLAGCTAVLTLIVLAFRLGYVR